MPLFSYSQHTKVVPDSLLCIAPSQVTRHIEDAYTIKGMANSLFLEEKSISALNDAVDNLKGEITAKNEQIRLHLLQNENCQEDYKHISNLNKVANRKIRFQKALIYILGGAALIEFGYIGIQKIAP